MRTKVLVLVEGQTEETVVRDVLWSHLAVHGVALEPVLLKTKREKWGKAFKGGVTSFEKVRRDLMALLGDSSAAAVTTLIDYYGLPRDFPGINDRPVGSPELRVAHVESAFAKAIDHKRFLPHLTLHELEAWVFADPSRCSWVLGDDHVVGRLNELREQHSGAENINENPETAPSRRILDLVPRYQKTIHGPMAISEIGMDAVRAACPHADRWLTQLQAFGHRAGT
jgi:hypothetical protein